MAKGGKKETKQVCVNLEFKVLEKLEKKRGLIPRSVFINHLLKQEL